MAVDLLNYSNLNEQLALQEAATAGLKSMDNLIRFVSFQQQQNQTVQPDCREIIDYTVSNFRKVITILNRTGHARFRRSPVQVTDDSSTALTLSPLTNPAEETVPAVKVPVEKYQSKALTLDFTKRKVGKSIGCEAVPVASSTTSSSFMSTITGEGSVSNGKVFSSMSLPPRPPVSSGKPPIAGKRCRDHELSDEFSGRTSSSGKCQCKKRLVISS